MNHSCMLGRRLSSVGVASNTLPGLRSPAFSGAECGAGVESAGASGAAGGADAMAAGLLTSAMLMLVAAWMDNALPPADESKRHQAS